MGGGGGVEGKDVISIVTMMFKTMCVQVHLSKPLQAFGTAHQTQCPPATGLSSPPVNTDPY